MQKKSKVNFEIYGITTCETTIAMYIFPNISQRKGNQTMKFSQLTEYNMRNIFLEKLYTKCGGDIFPDPVLKNQN